MSVKIIKNYTYNVLHIFCTVLFPVLVFPYVSKVLEPRYYGKYNFALSIVSYFLIIAEFGTQTYGIKELIKFRKDNAILFNKTFSEILVIGFIMSILSSILYLICVFSIPILSKNKLLYIIVGVPIISSFLVVDYVFIATENYKRRMIRLVIIKLISLVLIFTLVKKNTDYCVFALIIVIPELFMRLLDIFSIRKSFTISELMIKRHVKTLMYIFFYTITTTIYLNVDSTMLGLMKGDSDVGYYALSIRLVKIMIPITTSLGIVLSGNIIEKIKVEKIEEIYKEINLYNNFIFFLSFPIIFLLVLLKKPLIILFVGEKYLNSMTPMVLMLPIIIFISMSRFYASQLLIPLNKEKSIFYVSLIGLFSNLGLNFLLIPSFGIVGAAVGTLISEFIVFNFRLLMIKKVFIHYIVFERERYIYIYASILAFIISFILLKVLNIENILYRIIVIVVFYNIIYLLILLSQREYFIVLFVKNITKYYYNKREKNSIDKNKREKNSIDK